MQVRAAHHGDCQSWFSDTVYKSMMSLNQKTAIRLLIQNPKDCLSHIKYFGSDFYCGKPKAGNDQSRADLRGVRVRGQFFLCGDIIFLTSCE